MSTTSMAIFSNPLFATYSVYARNASVVQRVVYRESAASPVCKDLAVCGDSQVTTDNQDLQDYLAHLVADDHRGD